MSSNALSKVTLIIPTLNRSAFLLRTLAYYVAAGFEGTILIGDSSDATHAARVAEYLKRDGARLRTTHIRCPQLDGTKTMLELMRLIDSPYVAFIGDDDVLLP